MTLKEIQTKIKQWLITDNGWMHIAEFLPFAYIMLFWAEWAHKAKNIILLNGALADLHGSHWGEQLAAYLLFFATPAAMGIEFLQGVLKDIPFSIPDVITSYFGFTLGFILYKLIPYNDLIFILSAIAVLAGGIWLFKKLTNGKD